MLVIVFLLTQKDEINGNDPGLYYCIADNNWIYSLDENNISGSIELSTVTNVGTSWTDVISATQYAALNDDSWILGVTQDTSSYQTATFAFKKSQVTTTARWFASWPTNGNDAYRQGARVEFRITGTGNATKIQAKRAGTFGSASLVTLIHLAGLKGDQGNPGSDGSDGTNGDQGIWYAEIYKKATAKPSIDATATTYSITQAGVLTLTSTENWESDLDNITLSGSEVIWIARAQVNPSGATWPITTGLTWNISQFSGSPGSDGTDGNKGDAGVQGIWYAQIYYEDTTPPSGKPTAWSIASTGTISGLSTGWTEDIPTLSTGESLYVCISSQINPETATFPITNDNDGSGEANDGFAWSNPIPVSGIPGVPGSYKLYLWQAKSDDAPASPTTYTVTNAGVVSGLNNGWLLEPPNNVTNTQKTLLYNYRHYTRNRIC